jgi:hypothetical protein
MGFRIRAVLTNAYDVFEVPAAASERNEPMGSRSKFWFPRAGGRWLFKATRPHHGEDWVEVLAAEIAEGLGLPHADYQLALCGGERGVVTPTFQPPGFDLVHGNELLQRLDPTYPQEGMRFVRTPKHTIRAVSGALDSTRAGLSVGWTPPAGIASAAQVFAGYLLLDAWIGNTDRHHENWAVLLNRADATVHLAPTFDHAASLGSHETDETRARRLSTRDEGFTVEAYVRRPMARSALYGDENDPSPLTMLSAYRRWVDRSPTDVWGERLRLLDTRWIEELVERIPTPPVSGPAKAFAAVMLKANRERILRGE